MKKKEKPSGENAKKNIQLRSGAQCVVDGLVKAGCEVLFAYPGGQALDMFDSIYTAPFQVILPRHEQGGAHMADGYARATGKVGCCLVTSGPGATNTVTGLATANMDGIPMVCITGQVPANMIGNDAFQEADVMGITRSVSKHNFLVRDVDDLPEIIAEAFHIASTGKPGPVVIDIPKNVQRAMTAKPSISPDEVKMRAYHPENRQASEQDIKLLAQLINHSVRPLLYVGGGTISANASKELAELARKAQIPVCTTLMGLGAFPETDPLSLRLVGMHGTPAANYAVDQCDLLISAGARFSDRVTGKVSEFASRAKIVHIDIDPSAISKSVPTDVGICSDVRQALQKVLPLVRATKHDDWLKQCQAWEKQFPATYPQPKGVLMPQKVIQILDNLMPKDAIVATDVGQNQMWAAQYLTHTMPRHFLTSGGLGTMGYGIPAAIGAQVACPGKRVVAVLGDGGAQMTFEEVVVSVEHKLPTVFVILNNGVLGMVRQWQELFYNHHYSASILSEHSRGANEHIQDAPVYLPDFVKLSEAHGAQACRVTTEAETEAALKRAFSDKRTWVIECIVSPEANVFPMIPPGQPVSALRLN